MRWTAVMILAAVSGCAQKELEVTAADVNEVVLQQQTAAPELYQANIPTAKEVDQALTRAVSFLERHRELRGNAAPNLHDAAMSTWALIEKGEHQEMSWLKAQIDLLRRTAGTGREEAAFRALAFGYIWYRAPEMKEAMSKNGTALLGELFRKDGERVVLSVERREQAAYGAEALERLEHSFELPEWTWDVLREGWVSVQRADGSWSEGGKIEASHALKLTCMGIRTCHLAREKITPKEADCTGSVRDVEIERAFGSLAAKYTDLYKSDRPYETLYWISMAMGSVGRKRIGEHDWYREGLEFVLANQNKDGSWGKGEHAVEDTAFAMLFLTHGRQPLFACKLDYPATDKSDSTWNQRPNDLAHLATWVGRRICWELSWQMVDFQHTQDWRDAPFMFISGSQALDFNAAQIAALRTYVEDGGLIVGHADCNSQAFAVSFERLGNKLFPQYEFRNLANEHVLLNCYFRPQTWRRVPSVRGVSNGARELMLLLPMNDIGRMAELNHFTEVQTREGAQLMANVLMYANGKQFRYREEGYLEEWLTGKR